jgi:hypothetical protein
MKLVSIYAAAGLLEADMLKAFLEAQGLQVYLSQESVGRTLGLSAGTLGMVEVLVPEFQAAEAKELIAAIAKGEFENDDADETMDDMQD